MKKIRNIHWFDEVFQPYRKKNKARERMLQKQTRANHEKYQLLGCVTTERNV